MSDQRTIKYGNQTMPMPDGMTLDQAKAIMARHFPELAENPKIETKKIGDTTTYVFSKQAGRKGRAAKPANANRKVSKRLARVKPKAVIPPEILSFARGGTAYVSHTDDAFLARESAAVSKVRGELLALPPALPREEGAILL